MLVDDGRAIENLIYTYASLVDAGDFAAVGSLFASGSFVGSGGVARGSSGVTRMLQSTVILYSDGTPRTKHVTTNVSISLTGETAVSQAYFTVLQAVPDFPLQTIAAGRYRDSFTRTSGEWHFTERAVTVDLVGDISHHLRAKGS
ncbi:nuclear transport factor 2 family protein [Amycolatopsis sp. NPDC049252]|uniref:nuclear transport factor 2 family protein n=1 Tax=Amycolatopsis sp. NPDC049252 TaxID=3363933 RepID=UPI00371EA4DA